MNNEHWVKELDIEGWRGVFLNENAEPCNESEAIIYEQWIIASEVFVFFTRETVHDDWNITGDLSPEEDWEVNSVQDLLQFVRLNYYPDGVLHPLLIARYNTDVDASVEAINHLSQSALLDAAHNAIDLETCDED